MNEFGLRRIPPSLGRGYNDRDRWGVLAAADAHRREELRRAPSPEDAERERELARIRARQQEAAKANGDPWLRIAAAGRVQRDELRQDDPLAIRRTTYDPDTVAEENRRLGTPGAISVAKHQHH